MDGVHLVTSNVFIVKYVVVKTPDGTIDLTPQLTVLHCLMLVCKNMFALASPQSPLFFICDLIAANKAKKCLTIMMIIHSIPVNTK